jgi:hypothetical protein
MDTYFAGQTSSDLPSRVQIKISNRYPCAFLRKPGGTGPTNAMARAGHQYCRVHETSALCHRSHARTPIAVGRRRVAPAKATTSSNPEEFLINQPTSTSSHHNRPINPNPATPN